MKEIIGTILILLIVFIFYFYFSESEINFDNNATTKPHKSVLDSMIKASSYGNPSSTYAFQAKKVLEDLRCAVLNSLNLPRELYRCIITSGASESNNLLLRGFRGKIFVSAMEHKTSIECAEDIGAQIIPGDPCEKGFLERIPSEKGSLLSIMMINNETGNINPLVEISKKAKINGQIIHSDIVQFYGKFDKNNNYHKQLIENIDCFSISFHKIYGPVGVGCLIVPRNLYLQPQICGTQNEGLRGGTENVMACAGALEALKVTLKDRFYKNIVLIKKKEKLIKIIEKYCEIQPFEKYKNQTDLAGYLLSQKNENSLNSPLIAVILSNNSSINTLLVSFIFKNSNKRFCNIKFRDLMEKNNIKISIGSACSSSKKGSSHVLREMSAPFIVRAGVIRFSLGDYNKDSELYFFEKIFKKIIKSL